jgi:hypothetical protein
VSRWGLFRSGVEPGGPADSGLGGGQVLCSAATAGVVEGQVSLIDLGEHRLRDLDRPVRVFQIGEGGFPPLRILDAVPENLPLPAAVPSTGSWARTRR